MRNRTYGGVRGRKTKVGRKLLRFPPTRLVIFVIYLVSNQSSHFQKISQMNVLNAINVGLTVKPIYRNHVFGMTVFYQFLIAEFTLYRFLRSQQIGNLHIRHTIRFLGNKINLSLIHLTNIYFIPHPAQMDIYSVLHDWNTLVFLIFFVSYE